MLRQLTTMMLSPFVRQRLRTLLARSHEDMDVLVPLLEAGAITPVIDRTYSLDKATEAL